MIIGHQKQWQFLKSLAERGQLASAYLFSGQEKLGKKKLALEWASFIFQDDLEKKSHPDFLLVEPMEKEIQIGQIRDLIWRLSLKPFSAPLKAVVIDQAHLMNAEAQGAILKTLEEPKGKSLLVVISEHPEYLFPTIRSRVQTFKFYPVKTAEIEAYLLKKGISQRAAREITQISLGRPGLALDFIKAPQKLKDFLLKRKGLEKIAASDLAFRFQSAKAFSQDPGELKEMLDVWLSFFRGILLEKVEKPKLKPFYSFDRLKNILDLIQSTRNLLLTTNANPRLALEILMLEL